MLNVHTFKLRPDDTGCNHWIDGPSREDENYRYGLCAHCKNQVALKLDESGKPTGESFIVVTG